MIVLSGALVLVALVLLVFGALDRNLPYVYASIGVSVLSLLLLVVGILQRRGDVTGDGQDDAAAPVTDASAEQQPALVGAGREQAPAGMTDRDDRTTELVAPVLAPAPAAPGRPASRRVVPAAPPAEQELDDADQDDADQDDAGQDVEDDVQDDLSDDGDLGGGEDQDGADWQDETDEDVDEQDEASGVVVLVVSGRPRYHLEGCRVLRGKESQPLDRDAARTHGFSPCGVCKPDADEPAAAAADVRDAEEPAVDEPAAAAADVRDDEEPAVDVPAAVAFDAQRRGAGGPQTSDEGASFTETIFGEPLFADEAADGPDRAVASAPPADRPVQPVTPHLEPVQARQPDGGAHEPLQERGGPPTALRGDDPADDLPLETGPAPTADAAPDVAADPDGESRGITDDVLEPSSADDDVAREQSSPDEPVGGPAVLEPVADEAPVADGAPVAGASEEVTAPEPSPDEERLGAGPTGPRAGRAPSVRRPSKAAAGGRPKKATSSQVTPPSSAAAEPAPAQQRPAKKAPVKKGPAKKAPAQAPPAQAPPAEAPAAAPQVKRPLVRAVRPDALRLGAPSTGVTTTRVSARAAAPATAAPVVVVPDRDRFHRPACRFVRDVAGATSLARATATRQGYAACGACRP